MARTQAECPDAWCVLPAGHPPVRDVLPIPLQVHAASWWVRGAYLAKLEQQETAA